MDVLSEGRTAQELGAEVTGPFVLAQTKDVAVVVQSMRLHSSGLQLFVEWTQRRRHYSPEGWQVLRQRFAETFIEYLDEPDGLDIAAATATDETGVRAELLTGSIGGSGLAADDDRISGWLQVWIAHPSPQKSLDVSCTWRALGVETATVRIPHAQLHAAAGRVRPLWNDDWHP